MNQRRPGTPIVTFDTPMSYIIVDAYYYFGESHRTGEQTITPGNSFNGYMGSPVGTNITISFSSNGLTVTALISNSQVQSDIYFNIKGYGRRQ